MPSITEAQREYCRVAQLSQTLAETSSLRNCTKTITDLVQQIDNVNIKILNNKSGKSPLIGGTPLHIAAFHEHAEALHILLEREADFTVSNKNGHTVLHQTFLRLFEAKYVRRTRMGILENALVMSVLRAHVKFGIYKNPDSHEGLSHFHIACATNHVEAIQLFLDNGISVDERVNIDSSKFSGYTGLHFAVEFCGYAAAKLLLQHKADATIKDINGSNPLHLAILRGSELKACKNWVDGTKEIEDLDRNIEENKKIIILFLNDNRFANIDDMGFSKFHAACTLDDSTLAQSFLQDVTPNSAISINCSILSGYTSLHVAALFSIDVMKLLLKKGADIGAENADGETSFDLCMQRYTLKDLNNILLQVPTLKDLFFSDNETKLIGFINAICSSTTLSDFFRKKPKNLLTPQNCPLWPGYSLLHLAVVFEGVDGFDVAKLCLCCDDSAVMQQDSHGRTPIHLAFYQTKPKMIDLFFEHLPKITDIVDNYGLSHLHIAGERNNKSVVQSLLSQGADVNINYKGDKLNSVTMNETIQVEPSQDINKKMNDESRTLRPIVNIGSTPLHLAVSRRNIEIIKLLLKYGADANATDIDGVTPIHRLILPPPYRRFVTPQIVEELAKISELLLSSCDLKNIVSKDGVSHLHVASCYNNEHATEGLLRLGADANAAILFCTSCSEDEKCSIKSYCFIGYTPLHFAIRNQNTKLLEILLQNGADILYKKSNGMTLLYEVLTPYPFKYSTIIKNTIKILTSMLTGNSILKKRVEEDSGLTLLHIACHFGDVEQIRSLLVDPNINVNAKMHSNSPIWPSSTPLHLLMEQMNVSMEDSENLVKLLLKRGADISVANNEKDTPVHKAGLRPTDEAKKVLRLLVRYHQNFSLNPVNNQGISHLHLACWAGEYRIVEKFLNHGIDVNLPVDYRYEKLTFQTPLQFTLRSSYGEEARLQIVNVLLKYGADVNVPDEQGLTPLFNVIQWQSERDRYFTKLCEAGADFNCTNLKHESALESLFYPFKYLTNEEINFIFSKSNLINAYTALRGVGILSLIACNKYDVRQQQRLKFDAMMEVPSLFTVDQIGRTPIHNIVANSETAISGVEYANYIERFIKMGYNVDAQDCSGKTALHLAAYFSNGEAVSGLLIAGADTNITDDLHQTALAVLLEFHLESSTNLKVSKDSNEHAKNVMILHILTLSLCGLEVNSQDYELTEPQHTEERFISHCEQVTTELQMSEHVTIGTGSLTLRDFLTETGAVASRPSIVSETDRQAADNLLEFIDFESFPKLKILIKLQHRKMMERLALMNAATDSIRELLGSINDFSMPDICCRMILRLLSNTQVKTVITSVSKKIKM